MIAHLFCWIQSSFEHEEEVLKIFISSNGSHVLSLTEKSLNLWKVTPPKIIYKIPIQIDSIDIGGKNANKSRNDKETAERLDSEIKAMIEEYEEMDEDKLRRI